MLAAAVERLVVEIPISRGGFSVRLLRSRPTAHTGARRRSRVGLGEIFDEVSAQCREGRCRRQLWRSAPLRSPLLSPSPPPSPPPGRGPPLAPAVPPAGRGGPAPLCPSPLGPIHP